MSNLVWEAEAAFSFGSAQTENGVDFNAHLFKFVYNYRN